MPTPNLIALEATLKRLDGAVVHVYGEASEKKPVGSAAEVVAKRQAVHQVRSS